MNCPLNIFSFKHVLLGIWSIENARCCFCVWFHLTNSRVCFLKEKKQRVVLSLNFCPLLVVPLWSLMPPTRGYLSNRSVLCTVPRYELQQQQHFLSNCHGIAEMRQKSLKRRCLSNFNVSVFQAKRQQAACLLRDMAWISVDIVPLGLCFTFFSIYTFLLCILKLFAWQKHGWQFVEFHFLTRNASPHNSIAAAVHASDRNVWIN